MKINILYIPQLTVFNKQNGKCLITADSNIVIMQGIINEFLKQNLPVSFYIIMPDISLIGDFNESFNKTVFGKENNNINWITFKYFPSHSFAQRYHFDFKQWEIFKEFNIDIIINNTAPLTKNLRCLFKLFGQNPKIISFIHFFDDIRFKKVPSEISYTLRQLESIFCSDLVVTQSETVKEQIEYNFKNIFRGKHNINIEVWNCTYSQNEIDKYKTNEKFLKKTIIFPNRLSSTGYSNHKRFFEAVNKIYRKRKDFQVIINNPTSSYTLTQLKKECQPIIFINKGKFLSREKYLNILWKSDIGVALFTQEGHGGVSSKEFAAAECLPVFPKTNEYKFLMPITYKGFVKKDLSNLEESLNYVLDICRTKKGEELAKKARELVYKRDAIEANAYKAVSQILTLNEKK
ncbi:MAG: hypothetical protein ACTSVV_02020 [Promethearchaeota archaeon]